MKKILLFILSFTLAAAYGQEQTVNLIPQPVQLKITGGNFAFTKSSTVSYEDASVIAAATILVQKLNTATGFKVSAKQGKSGSIQLNLNKIPAGEIGKEGYTLVSSSKGVIITANEAAGLFNGIQTLLQLFPEAIESKTPVNKNWTVPAVEITDYPRFGWRGIMLDVSRNFFTKEDVKKYIDEISRYKINTFHWHLTDDNGWRIEIRSLPKLTGVGAWRVPRYGQFGSRAEPKPGEATTTGGFYTQDDIREIIKYAAERNITIIPEIDIPGHSMAAIASYPELSCSKDPDTKVNPGSSFSDWYGNGTFKMNIDNTLNPSDEKVYEFLDKVFTEVAALFPNQYIHVGGDECYKGFWAKDPGCKELMKKLNIRHVEDLQGYFMNRVESILKSKGKKLLGWDEILEGGISPEATLMSWRGTEGGKEAAKMGHDVVMTPNSFCYLDYQQGESTIEPPIYASLRMKKCYSFNPVPEGVDSKYILGGQGNLWTEQIPTLTHAENMTWPRGWALAEVIWSPETVKNWPDFAKRAEKQFDRADIAGINHSVSVYDAMITTSRKEGTTTIVLDSEFPGLDIYYTVDGSMPGAYSPKYSKPFILPDGPVTLRVLTCRDGKPIGHLITLKPEDLKKR
jgi:hexosaminidase